MMTDWLANALAALLCWGLWAFFPKLALRTITPATSVFYEAVGVMLTSVAVVWLLGPRLAGNFQGIMYALLTGIFGTIGLYFFFTAVKTGPISVISSLTAMYPLVTVVLAVVILHESIRPRQVLGIVLALVAAGLLAWHPE
jgi:transporter family protein